MTWQNLIEVSWLPIVLTGLGTLLALAGTILSSFQQNTLQDQLKNKTEQIVSLTNQNAEKIQNEVLNAVIGGNSLYFFTPHLSHEQKKLMLLNEFKGDYPLFDVSLSIEKFRYKTIGPQQAKYEKIGATEWLNLGTIHPAKNLEYFRDIDLSELVNEQDGYHYFLSFKSRNGIAEEDIYIRKEGTHYSVAYKVIRHTFSYKNLTLGNPSQLGQIEKVVKKVDANFPSHELPTGGGDIHWDIPF